MRKLSNNQIEKIASKGSFKNLLSKIVRDVPTTTTQRASRSEGALSQAFDDLHRQTRAKPTPEPASTGHPYTDSWSRVINDIKKIIS